MPGDPGLLFASLIAAPVSRAPVQAAPQSESTVSSSAVPAVQAPVLGTQAGGAGSPSLMPASAPRPVRDGGISLDAFLPSTALSIRPSAISTGDLEPDWLNDVKGPAVATVSVYVEADGSVSHVELRQTSNPRIGELVRNAFAVARFKPGLLQGKQVAARVDISIDYDQFREAPLSEEILRPKGNVLRRDQLIIAPPMSPDSPQPEGLAPS